MLPRLSRHYAARRREEFLSLWKHYGLFIGLLTVSLFVGIRIVGASLVHWMYAEKLDSALGLLYVIAAVPIVMGISNTINDAWKDLTWFSTHTSPAEP